MGEVLRNHSAQMSETYVIKRNGTRELVNPDKVMSRLKNLKKNVEKFLGRKLNIGVWRIAQVTIAGIYDGITTAELDEMAADNSARITDHPDYAFFAGHIWVSNLEAQNRDCLSFSAYAEKAAAHRYFKTGERAPLISDELLAIARKAGHLIQARMVMQRNYLFGYFGLQTLKGGYLLQEKKMVYKNDRHMETAVTFETPQHMWMRVALGIHGWNLEDAFELYDELSLHRGTMATPTLSNAGTTQPGLASCFLVNIKDDSIDGIFDTLKDCANISKRSGGVGLHISKIRARGSHIHGTNGTSTGIVPMARCFNVVAKYVDQGGGKRKGSFALYQEPWHPDFMDFVMLKDPMGAEDLRARDLFLAVWMCDLFYERVKAAYEQDPNEEAENPVLWSFFCPNECPGLDTTYGEEFNRLYLKYESEGRHFGERIPIKKVIQAILASISTSGVPYVLNKDSANRKSNQKNLGTITGSNLCVPADTLILTRECGYVPIVSRHGQLTHVWNGEEWSETTIMQTSEDSQLWKVTLTNGAQLYCTEYHRFWISGDQGAFVRECRDLKSGDRLLDFHLPPVTSYDDIPEDNNTQEVPLNASVACKQNWWKRYSQDGTCCLSGSRDFLQRVQCMLQTLGFFSTISVADTQHLQWRLDIVEKLDLLVKKVEPTYVFEPTYCFNEPKRHAGMFNGVLTSQCAEIIEYCSPQETAVCNLASLSLPAFVDESDPTKYRFDLLAQTTKIFIKALNRVIDTNAYPTPEAKRSNTLHRPVGLGIQGLALVFVKMNMEFGKAASKKLNKQIAEVMYYAALQQSHEEALRINPDTGKPFGPYESWSWNGGCPLSHGIFQNDMWKEDCERVGEPDAWKPDPELNLDWETLRKDIMRDGVRNSLLIAHMPTASTSNILNNPESFEPYYSMIFTRKTKEGEFFQMCEPLVEELIKHGLWNVEAHPETKASYIPMKKKIISNGGSIQNIEEIPEEVRKVFVGVYDVSIKDLAIMSRDRSIWCCQSESLNIYMKNQDDQNSKLFKYIMYADNLGLKTSIYYARWLQNQAALNFTGNSEKIEDTICHACSS